MPPLTEKRRFRAYGVGTAKSGSHSLAALFGCYRAGHEPQSAALIDAILSRHGGAIEDGEFAGMVAGIDEKLNLELNVSQLNAFLLDVLLEEFDDARFILTIRDCYSWVDSFINHQLSQPCDASWSAFRDFRFKPIESGFQSWEKILNRSGLYPLACYFSYWAAHNEKVISRVPGDRLLIVRTEDISTDIDRLAGFVGIDPVTLDASGAHSYRAEKKYNLLARLPCEFVESSASRYCRPLMERFFPQLPSFGDWLTGLRGLIKARSATKGY